MQGFNMGRYYPPDASAPPRFNTTHPLGARASKSSQGILTVRFELPFAVWCTSCTPEAIIGQGVRFNAQKRKVGNYYSTPIWSFRMKHTACGGWWEIRTDPKNAEYVVVEGARRREYGSGEAGEEEEGGEKKFLSEEERERRREDAFASLEGKVEEKGQERGNKERVEELYEQAEVWRDPYEVNARLRRGFRAQRKVLKREERYKEGMQEKFSLGLEIADETEADGIRAQLVEFGTAGTSEDKVEEVARKPLFVAKDTAVTAAPVGSKAKKLKAEIKAENSRQNLQQTLVGNTMASIDPFLSTDSKTASKMNLGILKRKRTIESPQEDVTSSALETVSTSDSMETNTPAKKPPALCTALVDYDSD